MKARAPRDETPWVVRFMTMGRPSTRERMVFSLVLMLAMVVVATAVWLADPEDASHQFLLVTALAFSAAQALAIRWIDRNGTWAPSE
jgi:hypothetical protein